MTSQDDSPGDAVVAPWRAHATVWAFLLWPFADFVAVNVGERLELARLVMGLLAVGASASFVLWQVERRRGRQAAGRLGVVFAAGLFVAFGFETIRSLFPPLPDYVLYLVWAQALLGLAAIAARAGRHRIWRTYFLIVGTVLVGFSAAQVAIAVAGDDDPVERNLVAGLPLTTHPAVETPDIYVFMADAYGSTDVLLAATGVDVGDFEHALFDRGFDLSPDAWTNYPVTFLSFATMLEMDYVLDVDQAWADRSPFYAAIGGDNAVVDTLRAYGYTYIHVPAGVWGGSDCSAVPDECLEPNRVLNETEFTFLRRTPLADWLMGAAGDRIVGTYVDPIDVVQRTDGNPDEGPRFVLAHIMSPHPPYRRTADCRERPDVVFRLEVWDEVARPLFADAVQCLNRQLLVATDAILARDPDAIIVIQGDHGPSFDVDWEAGLDEWTDAAIDERFPIFSAIRFPDTCPVDVPDDVTPVNTFRLVLSCLQERSVPLLPNRHFVANHDRETPLHELEVGDAP